VNDVVAGVDIAACLQLELDAARAFLGTLQQEQGALVEGEIERLEALASDKMQMVGRLAELAARRNRCLASLSLDPDSKGMEAWFADCPRDTLAERPVTGTGAQARYPQTTGFAGNESARPRDTLAERPVAGTGAQARYPQTAGFAGNESARPDATAAAAWRYLLQLAQTARQLNRTNGEMIAARLQHNRQAFAALQSAAGAVSLYGPQGQTLGYSGGRPLGRV
jgi:flagellar biosynthesis/type III secretory pathway chaperone